MSFGGSVQGMITSLKNNNIIKNKRKSYFDSKNQDNIYKKGSKYIKATPEQLEIIRKKLKKEKRKTFYLNLIFFVIFISLFFYLLNIIF